MVNYFGSMSPIMKSVIDRLTIGDLYKPEVRERVTSTSTFYFPPKEQLPFSDYVREVVAQGEATEEQLENMLFPIHPLYQLVGSDPLPAAYTEYAKKAIAALPNQTVSSMFRASPAMQKAMERISLSSEVLETYLRDPVTHAMGIEGLTDAEREALASGDFWQINAVMSASQLYTVRVMLMHCTS